MIGCTILETEKRRSNLESSQQARLSLHQGTEFKHAPTLRTGDSLCTSTHKGRSSESTVSCTLFNHSWISSLQSVQKETRRTYHLMMLRFTLVSTDSGVDYEARTTSHETHPISRHWSRVAHDPIPYHWSNQTTEKSSPPGNHSSPSSTLARLQNSASSSLYAFSSVRFSRNSSALDGWRGKDVSMYLISRVSFDFKRVEPTTI